MIHDRKINFESQILTLDQWMNSQNTAKSFDYS